MVWREAKVRIPQTMWIAEGDYMERTRCIIGRTYRLSVDGVEHNVTLITAEDDTARVLIQNHSIDMSLNGFTRRKKMYSQAVPVRVVPLSELQEIEEPKTKRGLTGWSHVK